jgi:hypothetical protein
VIENHEWFEKMMTKNAYLKNRNDNLREQLHDETNNSRQRERIFRGAYITDYVQHIYELLGDDDRFIDFTHGYAERAVREANINDFVFNQITNISGDGIDSQIEKHVLDTLNRIWDEDGQT